eukprot:COSAG05_NODE_8948_length_659_cov_0.942857_1_plen_103_part_00
MTSRRKGLSNGAIGALAVGGTVLVVGASAGAFGDVAATLGNLSAFGAVGARHYFLPTLTPSLYLCLSLWYIPHLRLDGEVGWIGWLVLRPQCLSLVVYAHAY